MSNTATDYPTEQDNGTAPITGAFLEAPSSISVPLWVKASGVSHAATHLADALLAGAMTVHGDHAPTLNREFLAWWLGVKRYDKGLQKPLDELAQIGFLVIFDGGVDPKTGRRRKRRDPLTGQQIPDTYAVRMDSPPGYVGPRNLAEAAAWFADDRDAAYRAHHEAGRKGAVSITRTKHGRIEDSQVRPTPSTKGVATPPTKGVEAFPQVRPTPSTKGVATPPTKGVEAFPQVRPTPSTKGVLDREREGTPSREFPPSIDRRATPPGDAGPGGAPSNTAMAVVARSPWPSGQRPNRRQHVELALLVDSALQDHGLSEADVQDYVIATLQRRAKDEQRRKPGQKANPAGYVANALAPDMLPIPTPSDAIELPQPEDTDLPQGPQQHDDPPPAAAPALPACSACRSHEGDPLPWRTITVDGRERPCPDCRPKRTVDAD
ncbi:hypothetical protein [Prauserella endophytica]|uniref:DUF1376 domain-containing protein n=1 Tax=Prauserella endophytica TaxID=1592324 RepID=A0ABY2RVZ5_9PSEU|nr:hypothetical protein [Prauserella endophytica]TKG61493.1 hypothetical protein FCN18_33165 [Prauserella endophytica]